MYLCERRTGFLCEHALDVNAQLNVDEKQALGEQFKDAYREWRMLIRILMTVFASAKQVTNLYNIMIGNLEQKKVLNWFSP